MNNPIPSNCVFKLDLELTDVTRNYSCHSNRFDIDETIMILFLVKVLNKKIPTKATISIFEQYIRNDIVYDLYLTINDESFKQKELSHHVLNAKYLIMFISKHEYFKRLDDSVVRNRLDIISYILDQSV